MTADASRRLKALALHGVIRWVNPISRRYYEATLQVNLFGDWEVLNVWGGVASPRGGYQRLPVSDQMAGVALVAVVSRRRERRAYERLETERRLS